MIKSMQRVSVGYIQRLQYFINLNIVDFGILRWGVLDLILLIQYQGPIIFSLVLNFEFVYKMECLDNL